MFIRRNIKSTKVIIRYLFLGFFVIMLVLVRVESCCLLTCQQNLIIFAEAFCRLFC